MNIKKTFFSVAMSVAAFSLFGASAAFANFNNQGNNWRNFSNQRFNNSVIVCRNIGDNNNWWFTNGFNQGFWGQNQWWNQNFRIICTRISPTVSLNHVSFGNNWW